MARAEARAGLYPALGAGALTLFAVLGTLAFLYFENKEQGRFLGRNGALCRDGSTGACDALRTLCLKREGGACLALADAHIAPGPNHDTREGVRLLGEGCTFRSPEACSRGGRILLEGKDVPRDEALAKRLLERGCELKTAADCALVSTLK